jgi:hypothetical protein
LCSAEPAAERVLVDVVREDALAVDLGDRDLFAVPRLELGRAVDRDFLQLELELLTKRPHLRERALAEVTPRAVEDRNLRDRAPG